MHAKPKKHGGMACFERLLGEASAFLSSSRVLQAASPVSPSARFDASMADGGMAVRTILRAEAASFTARRALPNCPKICSTTARFERLMAMEGGLVRTEFRRRFFFSALRAARALPQLPQIFSTSADSTPGGLEDGLVRKIRTTFHRSSAFLSSSRRISNCPRSCL